MIYIGSEVKRPGMEVWKYGRMEVWKYGRFCCINYPAAPREFELISLLCSFTWFLGSFFFILVKARFLMSRVSEAFANSPYEIMYIA